MISIVFLFLNQDVTSTSIIDCSFFIYGIRVASLGFQDKKELEKGKTPMTTLLITTILTTIGIAFALYRLWSS
jgi:hypothetical protein